MTKKKGRNQLLCNKQAANRSRKMIRQVFKKPLKRTDVYKVWDAYLEWFFEELLKGKEVKGMANVGTFVIEKSKVPANIMKLRAKGIGVKNGFVYTLKNINTNNLNYIFKVNFIKGKSIVDGVKFTPCKALKSKIYETVVKGKDFRECRSIG